MSTSADPSAFQLDRFLEAQAGVYENALAEIRRGRKTSHWMWFVFPQIEGLGHSPMARRYALRSLAEARAYLAHPLLGERLRACVEALGETETADVCDVLGNIDAMKLHSSLTLFAQATDETLFADALDRWFDGRRDQTTLRLI